MPRRYNRMPSRVLAHLRPGNDRVELDGKGEKRDLEVDEVVLGDWLHVEQMDVDCYWLRLGEQTFNVTIDPRTGKAKEVKQEPER